MPQLGSSNAAVRQVMPAPTKVQPCSHRSVCSTQQNAHTLLSECEMDFTARIRGVYAAHTRRHMRSHAGSHDCPGRSRPNQHAPAVLTRSTAVARQAALAIFDLLIANVDNASLVPVMPAPSSSALLPPPPRSPSSSAHVRALRQLHPCTHAPPPAAALTATPCPYCDTSA